MSVSDKVCKCLDKLWANEEMCDFIVQIDDVSIKCHRVILGACSPFFLGLLRSGMKEAKQGRAVLQDISVSTFQLILKTLYTGEDVLSLDNFIEIWHAVDMLQIGFLVELCETFAAKNIKLDNFRNILSVANLFNSKSVLSSVKTFMIQNIEAIYIDKLYLELSFDEIYYMVHSHELHFSTEYPVLEIILNWAEYKPVVKDSEAIINSIENNKKFKTLEPVNSLSNASMQYNFSTDRFDQLNILLKLVRTCIISPSLLVNVLEHRLIKRNDKAREIIVSSILKQTSFRHGQWPTAGIYRQFHEFGNFCVSCMNDTGKFLVIDPLEEKRYTIKSCPRLRHNIKLVAFDKELYAASGQFAGRITSDMFVYRDNSWTQLDDIPGAAVLLASNDQYIYTIAVLSQNIFRLNPKTSPQKDDFFTFAPNRWFAKLVMSYQNNLLVFSTETVNGVDETEIHMLDLQAKSWTRLDNLEGPAENIISFRNDDNHFVLQTNGNLWVLKVTEEKIRFTHVAKLWNLDHILYGAVVYGDKLVIFYKSLKNSKKDTFVSKLDNTFRSVSYYKLTSSCSNVIPFVVPKYCLSEY